MSIFEREECALERHVRELSEYVVGGRVELGSRLRLPPLALRVELPLERALQLLDSARPSLELLLIRRQYPLHNSMYTTRLPFTVLVDAEAITARK